MIELEASSVGTEHRGRWKWFLASGVLLVVLGIAGVSMASFLQLSSVVVFGPLLLASSLFQVVTAIFAEERKEKILHFLAAGPELILGFLVMAYPPERVVDLVALIAVFLIISGLARLARSLATRSGRRGWVLFTGGVAVLLGISLWVGGPVGKLWLVGLCIAVDFLCHGVSWSALAWRERNQPMSDPPTN